MISIKVIFSVIGCLGLIGLLIFLLIPKRITQIDEEIIVIRCAPLKTFGLIFLLQVVPSLLILLGLIEDLSKINLIGLIAGLFLIIISLTSICILISYLFNDALQTLTINLKDKSLTITKGRKKRVILFDKTLRVCRVSSKFDSYYNPLSLLEYIRLDDKILITNTSVDIDAFIDLLSLKRVDKQKKWLPILTR